MAMKKVLVKKACAAVMAASIAMLALAGCDYSSFTAGMSAATQTTEAIDEKAEEIAEEAVEAVEEAAEAVEGAAEEAVEAEVEAAEAAEVMEKTAVRIMALKGPTAMGMVKMMDESDNGEYADADYEFSIVGAVDEVPPALAKGETDIAAVPANLASVLYNNLNGSIEVLAVNTLGVIYIVENGDTVTSVDDLKGRTIYASGKGATPEYAINYILAGHGIDPETDVTIEWKSEHAECLAALLADDGGETGIAMLPQPFVTTAQMQNEGIRVALDLTEEWEALQEGAENASAMITGVVVARKAFVEENPEAVAAFMDRYAASVEFVNANTDEAAALVGKYEIVPEGVAKKALPACNITFIEGEDLVEKLGGYLAVLMEQNPQAVGGALPAEDFYYKR